MRFTKESIGKTLRFTFSAWDGLHILAGTIVRVGHNIATVEYRLPTDLKSGLPYTDYLHAKEDRHRILGMY